MCEKSFLTKTLFTSGVVLGFFLGLSLIAFRCFGIFWSFGTKITQKFLVLRWQSILICPIFPQWLYNLHVIMTPSVMIEYKYHNVSTFWPYIFFFKIVSDFCFEINHKKISSKKGSKEKEILVSKTSYKTPNLYAQLSNC